MRNLQEFCLRKINLKDANCEISFDSIISGKKIQHSAWIEINDFKPVKSPNPFPKGLKLSLIVYCGKPEFVGKKHLQDMTISNKEGVLTASIFWRAESFEYLMGISNCLKTHKSLNLFVNLGGEANPPQKDSSVTIDINHLSVTFS